MLTIEFFSSKCEWGFIAKEAELQGFKDDNAFIIHKIRKIGNLIPVVDASFSCQKERKRFRIYDDEFIRKLNSYCFSQKINPSTLMRRLVVDPVVRKHLLGEALEMQD